VVAAADTKEGRPDERPVDDSLISRIDRYIALQRPVLAGGNDDSAALWLSSNDGTVLTYNAVERIMSQTTTQTIGVNISPHLFRTAGACSCAVWAGNQPNLASAE
jgi:site-specific recombinase XerD